MNEGKREKRFKGESEREIDIKKEGNNGSWSPKCTGKRYCIS